MPKLIAVGEYHTSTSIESSAAIPSAGEYCENPVSTAACFHSGSSSTPSTEMPASRRGMLASSWWRRPW